MFLFPVSLPGEPAKSSSHFHCLKCDYVCTDTNKVVAHRRHHQKQESIANAGFEKSTPGQSCSVPQCPYDGKQTHYHCRKCGYAVLGLSQMEAHKFRCGGTEGGKEQEGGKGEGGEAVSE